MNQFSSCEPTAPFNQHHQQSSSPSTSTISNNGDTGSNNFAERYSFANQNPTSTSTVANNYLLDTGANRSIVGTSGYFNTQPVYTASQSAYLGADFQHSYHLQPSSEYFRSGQQSMFSSSVANYSNSTDKCKLSANYASCALLRRNSSTDINNNATDGNMADHITSDNVYTTQSNRSNSEANEKTPTNSANNPTDTERNVVEDDNDEELAEEHLDDDDDDDDDGDIEAEGEEDVDEHQVRTIYLSSNCMLHSYITSDITTAVNEHFQRSFALYFNFRSIGDGNSDGRNEKHCESSNSLDHYYKNTGEPSEVPGKFVANNGRTSGADGDLSDTSPGTNDKAHSMVVRHVKPATSRCSSRSSSSNVSAVSNNEACRDNSPGHSSVSGDVIPKMSCESNSNETKCSRNSDDPYYLLRFRQHQKRIELRKRRYLRRLQLLHTPMIKRKLPASFWKFNARFSCYYYASIYGANGHSSANYNPYTAYSKTGHAYSRGQTNHSQYTNPVPYQPNDSHGSPQTATNSYGTNLCYQQESLVKPEDNGSCVQYNRPLSLSVSMTIGATTTPTTTTPSTSSLLSSAMSTSSSSTSAAAAAAAAALATLNNDLTLDMSIHISPNIPLTTSTSSSAYLASVARPIGTTTVSNTMSTSESMAVTATTVNSTQSSALYHSSNHSSYLGLLQSSFNTDTYYYANHSGKFPPSSMSNQSTEYPHSYSSIYSTGSTISTNTPCDTWRAHYSAHYPTPFSQMVAQMQQHNVARTVPYYSSIGDTQYPISADKTYSNIPLEPNADQQLYAHEADTACATESSSAYGGSYQLVTPNG